MNASACLGYTEEAIASDPGTKGPHMSPTTISDVAEGVGLDWARKFGSVGPSQEFIGLQKDLVILDYPSPLSNKYQGTALDLLQIQKCKRIISKKPAEKEKTKDLGYIVEFPKDDDEKSHSLVSVKLQQEEESQLIVSWNNSLSFKRYREDVIFDDGDFFDYLLPQGKKSKILNVDDDSSREDAKLQQLIQDRLEVKVWEVTFIYGNPTFQQRTNLCDRIQALRICLDRPWIMIGDFNKLLYQHEKDGMHPQQQLRMNLFRQFFSNSGLMDLEVKGCRFIWYSNPHNGFVTREKLDKILVNWEWRSLFPNAMAIAIPSTSSDHTPIICWPKPNLKSCSYFKFEAFWEEHEDCSSVIQEGVPGMGQIS
ncbi:Endonuclease/exonuclease/phosphatase superfamily [Sesbania bispinosa]|nr:Endonuclease/exonuclease/phosphatase superfamily [Sesbania bispinosa]